MGKTRDGVMWFHRRPLRGISATIARKGILEWNQTLLGAQDLESCRQGHLERGTDHKGGPCRDRPPVSGMDVTMWLPLQVCPNKTQ